MDDRLKKDALIEDALRSQPLARMPRSVTPDVLSRIKVDSRPQLIGRDDVVLGLAMILCAGAFLFAAQSLPPIFLAKLRIQGILFYQSILVNVRWLLPSIFFAIAAVLAGMTLPSLHKLNPQKP